MYLENEVIMLVLGLGVLVFIVGQRRRIARVPAARTFLAAFAVFLAANVLTVLEGFFLHDILNAAEHICYAAGSILLARYIFQIFGSGRAR